MGLLLKESISLATPQGTSEVQLLFGDITQLSMQEKVDYIFVSAFPGDYTEVPGTLIGALKKNLGLRVRHWAKDKELDLRATFNCWVSKPLPDDIPFGRIVCLERMNRSEKLTEQISGMFRAMMPVFNNQDTTVITPLLASGNQGHSEDLVLKSIVKAACHWIKAGLPLRCLKIVLYKRDTHAISEEDVKLLKSFAVLKQKWESQKELKVEKAEKKFDVCLSFSEKDQELAKYICGSLAKVDVKIRIYSQHFTYNHEEVWQEAIFETMIHSKKIVAVLTPNYTTDAECLEQFSLALCCNRLNREEVLAPFYLQTVDAFPSYMTLVQYTECRVRREGEVAEQKIITACTMLVKAIDHPDHTSSKSTQDGSSETAVVDKKKYDVFISYAHRTPVEANLLYKSFLDVNPNLRIFIDKSELRTGNIWQESLYEAVDKARCVIALITESYLASTVCQEEYNIALARFMLADGICFIPMLTDSKVKEISAPFAQTPVVDIREADGRFMEYYHILAEWILQMMEGGDKTFLEPPRRVRIEQVRGTWRKHDFNERFYLEVNDDGSWAVKLKHNAPSKQNDKKPSKMVVFSFAKDCFKYAMALSKFLFSEKSVEIKCEFLTVQDVKLGVQPPKLQLLDSADMVIMFVSDEYLTSIQHRQELHTALCRQRTVKDHQVLYMIQANHIIPQPVYSHLLHHSVNLGDQHWTNMGLQRRVPTNQKAIMIEMPGGKTMTVSCTREETMALTTAAVDITNKLASGPGSEGSGMPTNIVNLQQLLLDTARKDKEEKVPVDKCSLVPFSALKDEKKAQTLSRPAAVPVASDRSPQDSSPQDSSPQDSSPHDSSPAPVDAVDSPATGPHKDNSQPVRHGRQMASPPSDDELQSPQAGNKGRSSSCLLL